MVVTRSGKLSSTISSPERRAYTQPSTPHTDSTVPMSAIYGDMEGRILHHFMGGIDLDKTGAAQRQEATDWAQLWTELDCFVGYTGDEGCHVLSFNKSTRRGECGLNKDGTFILFPLFLRGGSLDESGMRDRDVIEVVQFAKPTIMDKRFFKKMSYFVGLTCKDEHVGSIQHPKWLCDWDWYSFKRNILEPNRTHIQTIMQLSD